MSGMPHEDPIGIIFPTDLEACSIFQFFTDQRMQKMLISDMIIPYLQNDDEVIVAGHRKYFGARSPMIRGGPKSYQGRLM